MKAELMTVKNESLGIAEITNLDDILKLFNKYKGDLFLTNKMYEGWVYSYEADIIIVVEVEVKE